MEKARRVRATFTCHLDTRQRWPCESEGKCGIRQSDISLWLRWLLHSSAPQEEQPVHGGSQSKLQCSGSGCQIPGQMPSQCTRVGIRSVCPPGSNKGCIVYRNKKTAVKILRANLLFSLSTGNSLKFVEKIRFVLVSSLNLILKLN